MVSAASMVARLETEGVPSKIERGTPLLGEGQLCSIVVPSQYKDQATAILADGRFTDEELTFLATGQLSCDDAKE